MDNVYSVCPLNNGKFGIFSSQTFDLVFVRGPKKERITVEFGTLEEAGIEVRRLNSPTDAEIEDRIARISAMRGASRIQIIGSSESTVNISRKVMGKLRGGGDGCFYLRKVS